MRVVIIEDDLRKSGQLVSFVSDELPGTEIEEFRSYRSGLAAVLRRPADFVLLDMTIPTFDRSVTDRGGRTRAFGGRDILREMQRKGIRSPVVVVTGFETFPDLGKAKTLVELVAELEADFPESYLGTVYYHASRADWRPELSKLLRRALKR